MKSVWKNLFASHFHLWNEICSDAVWWEGDVQGGVGCVLFSFKSRGFAISPLAFTTGVGEGLVFCLIIKIIKMHGDLYPICLYPLVFLLKTFKLLPRKKKGELPYFCSVFIHLFYGYNTYCIHWCQPPQEFKNATEPSSYCVLLQCFWPQGEMKRETSL